MQQEHSVHQGQEVLAMCNQSLDLNPIEHVFYLLKSSNSLKQHHMEKAVAKFWKKYHKNKNK